MGSSHLVDNGKTIATASSRGCIYPVHCPVVPVVPAFALRKNEVPNNPSKAWNRHKGMYALRDITQGTRIVNESPILFLTVEDIRGASSDYLATMIFEDVMGMCKEQREFVWGLKVAAVWELDDLAEKLDKFIADLERFMAIPKNKRNPEENQMITDLSTYLDGACTKWRLAARVLPSLTSVCYDLPIKAIAELDDKDVVKGLFQTISSIQHSCMPNCQLAWNDSTMKMTVHTTKPIRAGEELTHNYFGHRTFLRDFNARAVVMRHHPMLWCRCPACNLGDLETVLTQSHIREILLVLATDPMLCDVESGLSPLPVLERAERHVLKLLELMKEAGCEDMANLVWLDLLSTMIYPRLPGKQLLAYKYAKLAADLAEKCQGADHGRTHLYYWKAQVMKKFGEEEVRQKLEAGKK